MNIVPNKFPTREGRLRIALVGEAPGAEEERLREPFVGASGRFLNALLSRAGARREECFVGNVCQYRPPGNNLEAFPWMGHEIQSGIAMLATDLAEFKPHMIVTLGGAPLHVLKHGVKAEPRLNRGEYKWWSSPTLWRGSLFEAAMGGWKCVATLHPAFVLRAYENCPLLQFDLKKAVRHAEKKGLGLPVRNLVTTLSAEELCRRMWAIQHAQTPIAIDIEGGIDSMSCISIANCAGEAFIVPFFNKAFQPAFSAPEQVQIWRALARLLEDPKVPKILQNSLYDRFVLQYSYGIRVRGVTDDTMLKWWELYCELEKSLDVQASICTDEPFYKGDRKTQDDKTFYEYCCRDSAVTYEINKVLETKVHGTSLTHYHLNRALLNPLLYMELRGMRYDIEGGERRRAALREQMFTHQAVLNGLVGSAVTSKEVLFRMAREKMAFKRAFITSFHDIAANCKKGYDGTRLLQLVNQPPTLATVGELEDMVEVSLNTGSNKQMCGFLYGVLGLPPQLNDEGNQTADYEALLKLTRGVKPDSIAAKILKECITIRALDTRQTNLSPRKDKHGNLHQRYDQDGRTRFGYNVVGSETGRVQCYISPTGNGRPGQGIPNYTDPKLAPGGILGDRDLYLADAGCWIWQIDLKGADGWTVAAYCAMLGDATMLEDYKYGLKPHNILTLRLRNIQGNYNDRAWLKEASRVVKGSDWDVFAMKRVFHGGNYLEGGKRMADNILTDSEGQLYVPPKECERMRDTYLFGRYPGVRLWHQYWERRVKERPTSIAASGSIRHFFGRPEDILPAVVAHEPQHNTTYATNLGLYRLWIDPENRLAERRHGSVSPFRVEPLHQVHDALVGQFRKEDTEWALSKIKSQWFANPLMIAGQRITIGLDGGYGRSWGAASSETEREGKI